MEIRKREQPYRPQIGDRVRVTHVHSRDHFSAFSKQIEGREMVITRGVYDQNPTQHVPGYWSFEALSPDGEQQYIAKAFAVEPA